MRLLNKPGQRRLAMIISCLLALIGILAVISACAQEPAPAPPVPPPAPAPAPAPVVNTVASLADKGVNIYNTACARCHGGSGQGGIGPPLMSDSANLSKYGTAQALFSFIKNSMPFSAPGSLPENEYHQVTAYLIMKNNLLPGDQKFEPADLANISLAK